MPSPMSPRERLLAALGCQTPDRVPLSFMIFTALGARLRRQGRPAHAAALVEAELALGMDAVVHLDRFSPVAAETGHSDAPGLPVRFHPEVRLSQWSETHAERRYPVLHKEYWTPAGTLSVAVDQTDDWPYGTAAAGDFHVPFMDDYLAPRCARHLVRTAADLAPLRYLLQPPTAADLAACRQAWAPARELARRRDLLLAAGWGVGGDALAWLCGLENAVWMAVDQPELLDELLSLIAAWNQPRLDAFLDFGVDLVIRRAWYEGTDFWSPALFRRFFLPRVRAEVQRAHQAGARYGYILTSGSMPVHEQLLEAGVDVLIGADPVQGKGTDLARMADQLRGGMAVWGGLNGFLTVERGTAAQVDAEVRTALETLGPAGFILSPVDNVTDPSDQVWANVLALVEAWRR